MTCSKLFKDIQRSSGLSRDWRYLEQLQGKIVAQEGDIATAFPDYEAQKFGETMAPDLQLSVSSF